jgi:predicted NBD/HSP70 family sugar kinase
MQEFCSPPGEHNETHLARRRRRRSTASLAMANRLTGKPQLNRFVNRRLILDKIRREGEISRADLAKQTAIRPPTVSAVIKELIDEGLVEEVGAGETCGGRAPRMLALARQRPRALGFEMSDGSILAALCDLNGDLCAKHQSAFKPVAPAAAVEQLHDIGAALLAECRVDWTDLHGVGVALPGHLNADTGHIRWSTPFRWLYVPLKRLCEERWTIATDVVNDSSAGGMASHLFDADKAATNLVFLYLRFGDPSHDVIGVGVGVILNGAPSHGEFGAAGEITTPVFHPLVHAKRSGLAEEDYPSLAALVAGVQRDEPPALAAIEGVARELGALVIHIVNLFEPGILVIGSDEPVLRDALLERFQRSVDEHCLPFQAGHTRLAASTLGMYGIARGAIVPTLQRLFRIPHWS